MVLVLVLVLVPWMGRSNETFVAGWWYCERSGKALRNGVYMSFMRIDYVADIMPTLVDIAWDIRLRLSIPDSACNPRIVRERFEKVRSSTLNNLQGVSSIIQNVTGRPLSRLTLCRGKASR